MNYLALTVVIAALILVIYLGANKKHKTDNNKMQTIKNAVILTILVNSVILTPLILIKMKGKLEDIAFLWLINFIVPYLGFRRLFNGNK